MPEHENIKRFNIKTKNWVIGWAGAPLVFPFVLEKVVNLLFILRILDLRTSDHTSPMMIMYWYEQSFRMTGIVYFVFFLVLVFLICKKPLSKLRKATFILPLVYLPIGLTLDFYHQPRFDSTLAMAAVGILAVTYSYVLAYHFSTVFARKRGWLRDESTVQLDIDKKDVSDNVSLAFIEKSDGLQADNAKRFGIKRKNWMIGWAAAPLVFPFVLEKVVNLLFILRILDPMHQTFPMTIMSWYQQSLRMNGLVYFVFFLVLVFLICKKPLSKLHKATFILPLLYLPIGLIPIVILLPHFSILKDAAVVILVIAYSYVLAYRLGTAFAQKRGWLQD